MNHIEALRSIAAGRVSQIDQSVINDLAIYGLIEVDDNCVQVTEAGMLLVQNNKRVQVRDVKVLRRILDRL